MKKESCEVNTSQELFETPKTCYGFIVEIPMQGMKIAKNKIDRKMLGDGSVEGYMLVEAAYTFLKLKAHGIQFGEKFDRIFAYWDLPEPVRIDSEADKGEMVLKITESFTEDWCHPDLKVKQVITPCFYGDELEDMVRAMKSKKA